MKSSIYGIEEAQELFIPRSSCILTSDFQEFLDTYGDHPVLYIHETPSLTDIQRLHRIAPVFTTNHRGLYVKSTGEESAYLAALATAYRSGVANITVTVPPRDQSIEVIPDKEGYDTEVDPSDKSYTFIKFYISLYNKFLLDYPGERTPFIERCAEPISFANDSVRVVNFSFFYESLFLKKGTFSEILKPYLAKRKSRMAINAQRFDEDEDDYDPDELTAYVEDTPAYKDMHRQYKFYPRLNKDGEPICYMFQQEKGGHIQVGDFFMTPLLHIYSDDDEANKRVLKINRRYYKTPLYIEVASRTLLKKSTIEEKLICLEAVNFTNGEEKHWTKIREYMSRNFITCAEITTYGNQQTDGASRREDNMFFAFSNGIFYIIDGIPRFEPVNELGVVTHNNRNYYLPAFSAIYAGTGRQSDKYELMSQYVRFPK